MTMIPLSSPATSGIHQTSPPWGHCIRFPGARFVSQTNHHLALACSLGLLQLHPGAVLPNRAPAGFLPRGPCFRPSLTCGVRPKPFSGLEGRGSSRNRFEQVNGILSLSQINKEIEETQQPLVWQHQQRRQEDNMGSSTSAIFR
jgi:hypothetical protein